ncbi:MAG: DUF4870 domain-containing protein [Vicinamibacteria bacterium]
MSRKGPAQKSRGARRSGGRGRGRDCEIGIPLLIALMVYAIVSVIIASVKANEGIRYRYPICLRLIK